METHPVSETLCFLVSRIQDDGQSPKPSNSEYNTPSSEPFIYNSTCSFFFVCFFMCLLSFPSAPACADPFNEFFKETIRIVYVRKCPDPLHSFIFYSNFISPGGQRFLSNFIQILTYKLRREFRHFINNISRSHLNPGLSRIL
jgi:hypothetical protein